ncbi:hypothetical protein Q75_11275 [Bacillus coahuilensis p1.1.43]|uniref:Activator of Hsp90 ATPase homologue 1/2-like C-terminal domain-containing protein n=1 Tax=Bacillus coahuilensis p1.1.43 TaxID=1150625 RepID=A0A147K6U3_9BACI|nr:SRPBCC family protein [Bacillus coahuilensis]KUP05759.1 hypothetical protein Q75_11275 [Bacillus coahuilensis p1.1.43]
MKFTYTIYILASKESVWDVLTKGSHTEKYFFSSTVDSKWDVGSLVTYKRHGELDVLGEVVEITPYQSVTFTWRHVSDHRDQPTSVTFLVDEEQDTVKLTLIHDGLVESDFYPDENHFIGVNNGWPAILSNLKSYIETGLTLPRIHV